MTMHDVRYHIISGSDNTHILYCDSNYAIFNLDEQTAKVLLEKEKYHKSDEISSKIGLLPSIKEYRNNTSNLRSVDRITLCVSNDCNLRCKYCYALGGNYGATRGLMSKDIAKKFIEFCRKNFDHINKIVFFGGEPMLNTDIISFVCKEIKDLFASKAKPCPIFGLITNGTIHNSSAFYIIKKYMSYVTVSIDGPEAIHDKNRVYANGSGSYKKVEEFIKKISIIPNLYVSYEATFTNDAIKAGYNLLSLKNFFNTTLGINGVIVNDSHLDRCIEIQNISSITTEQIISSNFECLPASFWKILDLLVKRENNTYCNVGYRNFSVSSTGELYICHTVNEKKHCNIGSIKGKNLFNNTNDYQDIICSLDKNSINCKTCWCRNLCGGCTIDFFYKEVSNALSDIPNHDFCAFYRQYLEQILVLIARIRKNVVLWEHLLNKIKK